MVRSSSLRCRLWLRSTLDPHSSAKAYRFKYRLAVIVYAVQKSEVARLKYRRAWVATIANGGPVHCGISGTLPPKVVLSIL